MYICYCCLDIGIVPVISFLLHLIDQIRRRKLAAKICTMHLRSSRTITERLCDVFSFIGNKEQYYPKMEDLQLSDLIRPHCEFGKKTLRFHVRLTGVV